MILLNKTVKKYRKKRDVGEKIEEKRDVKREIVY
jgi:hypothetical protein